MKVQKNVDVMLPMGGQGSVENRELLRYEMDDFLIAKGQRSAATRLIYQKKLKIFIQWLELETEVEELEDLQRDHIRAFLDHLSSNHSPGGVHLFFRVMRTWINWARREYDLDGWDPLKNVDPPALTQNSYAPVPIEDIQKLLDCFDRRTYEGARNDALVRFLVDTGVRASELMRLRIKDVDLNTGDVHLPAEATKTKKPRVVFLGTKALRSLRRCLKWRKERDPAASLFDLTYFGVNSMFNRSEVIAGLRRPISFHRLRKTYATESHRHGEDLETLRRKLGHSTLAVTQRYLGLNEDDLRNAHQEHSPGDRLL